MANDIRERPRIPAPQTGPDSAKAQASPVKQGAVYTSHAGETLIAIATRAKLQPPALAVMMMLERNEAVLLKSVSKEATALPAGLALEVPTQAEVDAKGKAIAQSAI